MAIDKDIIHKTAVSIVYSRTGNTLHRRERHGVKNTDGAIEITFDETTSYVGKDALQYLADIKTTRDSSQDILNQFVAANTETENSITGDIDFLSEQITEIEALL